jgi:exodeoxyribonuclease V gamma subunit
VAELQHIDGGRAERGLVVYRASRLEALLEPLLELLDAAPPDDVLTPQTVLAAHPGMRHWLARALAQARGPQGIVANFEVLLPSTWIDRLAQQQLGQQEVALPAYRRAQLRWAVFERLAEGAPGLDPTRIAHYLGEGSRDAQARRRFQLADRLARLYSQYMVYRPDWLQRWERGQRVLAHLDSPRARLEGELIAPLWRQLKRDLGAHRADVLAQLLPRLRELPPAPPLHVFGLNHCPPQELAVLRALADSRLVALYAPDPCREFWGGLSRDLDTLAARRAEESAAIEAAGEGDYFLEHGHPLLARWGRLGQQFFLALAEIDEVREDLRHWRDRADSAPVNRLQRLQDSLRRLDLDLLRVNLDDDIVCAAEVGDDSLRVHACHTRLRELEALREVLLAVTGADARGRARLAPGEIVVMAADIAAYVPLIAAVFGPAGDSRARLPYHLADVSTARSHRLFAAVRRLLALPSLRLSAPELIDLLQVPEIARRFGLDGEGVDGIAEWLRASHSSSGLDADFRLRFGLPPLYPHSFAWGVDRLLAGYLLEDSAGADEPRGVQLGDGSELAPLAGVHGAGAEQVGALDALLQALQSLFDLAESRLPLSRWAERLDAVFDSLFRIDPDDAAAREADSALRQLLQGLAAEPGALELDPELPFELVRDLLEERLQAVPERQPFLLGGITFCGMVPQRAIPFGLVAVLGLNEGEFPRRAADGGLDLMRQQPRMYDREQRTDDRYLFLETLMSARQMLHLSYLGAAVKDGGQRNPAAPLGELLALLDASAGLDPDDTVSPRPWRIEHPLQPFDPRHFDASDPRLYSHQQAFVELPRSGRLAALPPFVDSSLSAPTELPAQLELRALHGFWRDPARQVLAQGLQLRLDALDDERLPDSEPLQSRLDAREQVSQRLLRGLLQRAAVSVPKAPPAWLRLGGLLAPGRPGLRAWADERSKLQALLETLAAAAPDFDGRSLHSAAIDLRIERTRLLGEVDGLYTRAAGGDWLLRAWPRATVSDKASLLLAEGELDFKQRLPLFIDWACLRLLSAGSVQTVQPLRILALLDSASSAPWIDGLNAWDAALCIADAPLQQSLLGQLEARLHQLLQWWLQGQGAQLPYLPKSSWSALCVEREPAKPDAPPFAERLADAVDKAWTSAPPFRTGESDYAPGYARLLVADLDLEPGSEDLDRLRAFAERLHACLDLAPPP